MGGGNGAKSQQARDRTAAKAGKGPTSQLKTNQAAQSIQCTLCKQTFQNTSKQPLLQTHVESRHSGKEFKAAFPDQAVAV